MVKWVFVTGGVLSGLGKGMVSASVSKLLQSRGNKVVPVKCDGYLNVDPGTMNPHEHGEVFVLEDGGEVDMDFGHYERFLDINGRFEWNLTSGKVFQSVIDKEREGEYLGKTVQMIPHVTDEIKERFREIAEEEDADVMAIEIGGTVGDIENMLFLEAVRQLRQEDEESVLIHTTLVPYLETVGEQKTKPTQHSVKELERAGLKPDFVVGRSDDPLDRETKEKIALFCDVDEEAVISDPDIDNIYRLPLVLEDEGLDRQVVEKLDLQDGEEDMEEWRSLVETMENPGKEVTVAIAGKYTDIDDSYVSIEEALKHAGAHLDAGVDIELVETTDIERGEMEADEAMQDVDGVVIAPGFGERGTGGKLDIAEYCRENGIPTLGICFGLQMMTVEFARHVAGLEDAHSTEIDEDTPHPVIDVLPEQLDVEKKGGTMRLGGYEAELEEGTKVHGMYGEDRVVERHRHRYEVNPEYHDVLRENGLVFSGTSKGGKLVEYIELEDHPFYVGTQAHPEFTSRLEHPNPLYRGFIRSVLQESGK
ncbi:MAG: CTP synthase [Candidatus Nanohaloarchaea archaeon]